MYFSKYLSLLNQSNFNNPLMAANQIAESNNTFDVEFVMVPFGYQKDSTIVVSDKEIKAYYNAHKKFYKQTASRDIEYVEFEIKPSAEDVAVANEAIAKVYDEFKSTNDVKNFLSRNSDRKFDETWYKDGELNTVSRKVNDFVFNSKNKVSEVIDDNESLFVVRVLDTKKEDGVEKKQVAIFEKVPFASEKTKSACYAKANAFAAVATGSYENFKNAVQEQGLYARPVTKMAEGTDRLGSIERTKEITRWAFDAKKGNVSEIKNIDNKYFVVAVLTGIHEEGYVPVSEVASMIEDVLYSEKLAEKKVAEVADKIAGLEDMQAIADTLGTTVSTQEDVVFTSTGYQSLDPKFVGAASVAEDGKISAPVAGNIGVYVYKVTGRETGASFTEEDAKNLANQKSYYAAQMLLPTMMEDADVKDNRARFF
jgi:parvulin-like peptidyl-prolyl isomerase